jgi:signal transduction histidine kinase
VSSAPPAATTDARTNIGSMPVVAAVSLVLVWGVVLWTVDRPSAQYAVFGGLILTAVVGGLVLARMAAVARTLAAKQDELRASRERLHRYVADLERISQVASHDMQEPLRRVVAYAQLLADPAADDADRRDYAGQVVEGARRMRDMVRELEAFVSVEQLPAPVAAIPADQALASACARLNDSLAEAGARIVAEPLPRVAADEGWLVEIFARLIDNAVRFRAPERPPLVTVSAGAENGMAVLRVADNGIGIEPRQVCRLFEAFHRPLDGEEGAGMGLAVVRRMIERLGGRIWVEQHPGDGSVFAFTLPLEPAGFTRLDQEARVAA